MTGSVTDNVAEHRFEMPVGDALAVAYYEIRDERIVLTHTEVPAELSGRGIGSALARGVFEAVRASGGHLVPRYDFMAAFARRHPEYDAIVEDRP